MTPEISIILTVYNQSEESIIKSLRSVAQQKDIDYQLIVADDHSSHDPTSLIEQYCKESHIQSYQVVRHPRNVKTIGNILHTEEYVHGEFVKVFGAGDELYDEHTLREIVDFCKEHSVKIGFGNILKDVDGLKFNAPKNSAHYRPTGTAANKKLLSHQLNTADWIPGGAQFFKREVLFELMNELYYNYSLRYCEDFAGTIGLTEYEIFHLDRFILIYEIGTGITGTSSITSRRRMYDDHLNLYRAVRTTRPLGISYSLAYCYFMIRRFIALHTPLYGFLRKAKMRSYSESVES